MRPFFSITPLATEPHHHPFVPIPSDPNFWLQVWSQSEWCPLRKVKIIGLQACSSKAIIWRTKKHHHLWNVTKPPVRECVCIIILVWVLTSCQFVPIFWACSWAKNLLSQAFPQDFLYFLFLCETEIPWEWPFLWYFCTSALGWR